MDDNSKKDALKIALKYLLFGSLWIFLSDFFVNMIFESTRMAQSIKGTLFVLASAGFIYLLTWQRIKEINKKSDELRKVNNNLENANKNLRDREGRLEESQKRYALALKGVEGIWDYDFMKKELKGSNWLRRTLGRDSDVLIDEIGELIHPDDRDKFFYDINRYLAKEVDVFRTLIRIKNSEGEYIWLQISGTALWDEDDKPIRMVGLASDFSDYVKLNQRVKNLAYINQETNLPNRNSVSEKISTLVRSDKEFSLIYIGVDNFLQIENAMGSDYTYKMLKTVMNILKDQSDKYISLSYFGNFEFLIITKIGNEKDLIKDIFDSLDDFWLNKDLLYYISLSIGIEQFKDSTQNNKTKDQLIKNARLAMIEARKKKGNSYEWFIKDIYEDNLSNINLEEQLRKALIENQLFLEYQPILSLDDDKLFAIESLVRWNHPKKGVLYPDSFIYFAEKTQLINAIGHFVIEESFRELKNLHNKGFSDLIVAINMSPVEFNQQNLAEILTNKLKKYDLDSKYIRLEITENVLIEDFESAKRVLEELTKLGIRISLDDYGVGYSSFKYLQELPIDLLKIDKSFIMRMNYKNNKNFVKSAVNLGKSLDIDVVAEGVEDSESNSYLKKIGCDYGQGYFYQRPASIEDIEELLKEKN
ncbi:MAG: putative bifunctional diguanylate cyclase/phosphodiesterase [Clostridia bacterium]